METYDEIVGFDYTNVEEWRKFIEKKILPLYNSISKVIKLREKLEDLVANDFSNLIRNNINIRKMLLGGIDNNGNYKPNSLAKIYREFLGISINTKEWVILSKQPEIDVADYIKCNLEDTTFLQVAKNVKEITDKLLSLAGINKEDIKNDEIEGIIKNPEKIWNELDNIYKRLVSTSANYSYHTFFTINTRCIPRYYLEQAYPKLRNRFEDVAEFLGLEPIFIPDVKEEEIKRNYTLWGHKENGFADLLYKLNETIWNALENENLRERFYNKVREALSKIKWKFPEYIHRSDPPNTQHVNGVSGPYYYEYEINGMMITAYRWWGISARGNYWDGNEKCNISLLNLFDDLSPCLFVGICHLDIDINNRSLRVW